MSGKWNEYEIGCVGYGNLATWYEIPCLGYEMLVLGMKWNAQYETKTVFTRYEIFVWASEKKFQGMKNILKVWKKIRVWNCFWGYEKVLFGYEKKLTFENSNFMP